MLSASLPILSVCPWISIWIEGFPVQEIDQLVQHHFGFGGEIKGIEIKIDVVDPVRFVQFDRFDLDIQFLRAF